MTGNELGRGRAQGESIPGRRGSRWGPWACRGAGRAEEGPVWPEVGEGKGEGEGSGRDGLEAGGPRGMRLRQPSRLRD